MNSPTRQALMALVLLSTTSALALDGESNVVAVDPVSIEHAGILDVWSAYAGKLTFGKGQTLALLDDGCKLSMPEWSQSDGPAPKVLVAYNSVDGNDDPKHVGRGYHGSTIGFPSSLNYKGKRGVAFNNQVAVVRALECCHCNVKDSKSLAAGLQWVIDNHVKHRIRAVNLAPVNDLEHAMPVPTEIDAKLKRLRELGIWVSAPAGNHQFTKGISWPACQPDCFAVGAVRPGKDEVYLDRSAKIDLVVPAAATSSSNAILCGAVLLLREAIEKSRYDWKKDGSTLPDAMLTIFQKTGVPVRDPGSDRTFRRLDLKAAVDSVFLAAAPKATPQQDTPVTVAASPKAGGHIHPSICKAKDGTLVVVYKGPQVLMRARSTDGGKTWEKPEPIPTTAKRPEVIREVQKYEVYPGTADALPDGRLVVTWNYIADDKAKDGYYERTLLYTLSDDQGRTWGEQKLIGPVEGKHLGAVRHNVLPWGEGRWLLPLRAGPPRLFDPKKNELEVFPLKGADKKQHSFQQIVRTAKGTLLAMGPDFLRSTDEGKSWAAVENFPAPPEGDNAEGRYLTTLSDGRVLVTWGVGTANKGLRYNFSADDGKSWNPGHTVTLLPDTNIAARYYSARTIQIDDEHVGTVYLSGSTVYFLKVKIDRVAKAQ